MIINTIKQTGTILQSDDNRLCPQYSENLLIHVDYEGTYSGWSVKWDALGCRQKKRIPLEYDVDNQCITLNKECFIDEYLYIACAFVKDGMIVNTEPIELHIPKSVSHDLDTLPKVLGLYDEMNELFKQIFSNEYKQSLDDTFDQVSRATDDLNSTISELNRKLANDEFRGQQGIQGIQGEKGDKGDTGESGITTPVSGMFTLSVDANGDLYANYNDSAPSFTYNSETGELFYEI